MKKRTRRDETHDAPPLPPFIKKGRLGHKKATRPPGKKKKEETDAEDEGALDDELDTELDAHFEEEEERDSPVDPIDPPPSTRGTRGAPPPLSSEKKIDPHDLQRQIAREVASSPEGGSSFSAAADPFRVGDAHPLPVSFDVFRLTPEYYRGAQVSGFLGRFPAPFSLADLRELHGGELYRVVRYEDGVVTADSRVRVQGRPRLGKEEEPEKGAPSPASSSSSASASDVETIVRKLLSEKEKAKDPVENSAGAVLKMIEVVRSLRERVPAADGGEEPLIPRSFFQDLGQAAIVFAQGFHGARREAMARRAAESGGGRENVAPSAPSARGSLQNLPGIVSLLEEPFAYLEEPFFARLDGKENRHLGVLSEELADRFPDLVSHLTDVDVLSQVRSALVGFLLVRRDARYGPASGPNSAMIVEGAELLSSELSERAHELTQEDDTRDDEEPEPEKGPQQ